MVSLILVNPHLSSLPPEACSKEPLPSVIAKQIRPKVGHEALHGCKALIEITVVVVVVVVVVAVVVVVVILGIVVRIMMPITSCCTIFCWHWHAAGLARIL